MSESTQSASPLPGRSRRKYDIIVLGATGYTGKLTCENILRHAPSSLRWAIAGRSPQKLELLQHDFNRLYPDRTPVSTFICDLSEHQIRTLVTSTTLLITTVGPYLVHGTPLLEACAVSGTHYVDCTGEFPWVHEMVKKCHKTAVRSGAIIIPQCGFESAPSDLSTWALIKTLRENTNCPAEKVTWAMHSARGATSGGTFESVINLFEQCTLLELHEAAAHDALSPVKPAPEQPFEWPVHKDEDFGVVCGHFSQVPDRAQVFRSWGLMEGGRWYGENLVWTEVMKRKGWVHAWISWVSVTVFFAAMVIGPVRWVLRKLAPFAQGDGPTEETRKSHSMEYHGIAVADEGLNDDENAPESPVPRKAFVSFKGPDPYEITATMMTEIALAVLHDEKSVAKKLGGGVLTPACVASDYLLQRLGRAGVQIEARML